MKLIDSVFGWFRGKNETNVTPGNNAANQEGKQSAGVQSADTVDLQQSSVAQKAKPQFTFDQANELMNSLSQAGTPEQKVVINSIQQAVSNSDLNENTVKNAYITTAGLLSGGFNGPVACMLASVFSACYSSAPEIRERLALGNSFLTDLGQQGNNEKILADTVKNALDISTFSNYSYTASGILTKAMQIVEKGICSESPGVMLARAMQECASNVYASTDTIAIGKVFLKEIEKAGTPNEQLLARTTLDAIEQNHSLNTLSITNAINNTAEMIKNGTDQQKPVELLAGIGKKFMGNRWSTSEGISMAETVLKKIDAIGSPEDKILYAAFNSALTKPLDNRDYSSGNMINLVLDSFANGTAGTPPGKMLAEVAAEVSKRAYSTSDSISMASSFLEGVITNGAPTEKIIASTVQNLLGIDFGSSSCTGINILNQTLATLSQGMEGQPADKALINLGKFGMDHAYSTGEAIMVAGIFMSAVSKHGTADEFAMVKLTNKLLSKTFDNYAASAGAAVNVIMENLSRDDFRFSEDNLQAIIDQAKKRAWSNNDGAIIEYCIKNGYEEIKSVSGMRQLYETMKAKKEGAGEDQSVKHDESGVNIDGVSLKKRKARFNLINSSTLQDHTQR